MFDSAFGERLVQLAESKDKQCLEDPNFLTNTTFIDPSKIEWLGRNSNDWAYARTINRSLGYTWLATTNKMSMADFFIRCIPWPSGPEREKLLFVFDSLWRRIDIALWDFSKALDRRSEQGTVAKKFGLFDPADPERPSCMTAIVKLVGAHFSERLKLRLQPIPASQSSSENTPAAAPEPTVHAASGHAYLTDTQHLRAKEKVKTRGLASHEVPRDSDLVAEEEEEEEILPDVLPKDFKIGKKLLKVRMSFERSCKH
jgi:hypothetical protein